MDDAQPPEPEFARINWSAIAEDVLCPLCDYNLRTLVEPRCPECGYRFEWRDLLDPARRSHPYLFEHHPRRNVWSFLRTMVGGFTPLRFWNALRPNMPSRPIRLIVYWLIAASFGVIGTASMLACHWISVAPPTPTFPWAVGITTPPASAAPPWWTNITFDQETVSWIIACLLLVLWPWLSFLALMIFQISMRRAKINKVHVLRCVLYSFDLVFWAGICEMAMGAFGVFYFYWVSVPFNQPVLPPTIAIVAVLYGIVRLCLAYSQYLRFHAAVATVLASQVIVALSIPAAMEIFRQLFGLDY